jgi:hypothetical protein
MKWKTRNTERQVAMNADVPMVEAEVAVDGFENMSGIKGQPVVQVEQRGNGRTAVGKAKAGPPPLLTPGSSTTLI